MNRFLTALSIAVALVTPARAAGPDFANRQDFEFADRGFIATRADPKILAADGHVVWDLAAYEFLKAPARKAAIAAMARGRSP